MDRKKILKWIDKNEWFLGPFEAQLARMAMQGIRDFRRGETIFGWMDAHVHLDRVFTFNEKLFPDGVNLNEISAMTLPEKQDFLGFLHDGSAYSEESLSERMEHQIVRAIKIGTREIWAVIDTTPDIGFRAFNIAKTLKEKHANEISIKLGCYPLFGFKNPKQNPDRFNLLEEAAPQSDFIVGLPEKDDRPDKIGFESHVSILLDMAYRHGKELHIHVDQMNSATEEGSFRVIRCLQGQLPERLEYFSSSGRPKLWLIHVISPSCYEAKKFSELVRALLKYNIGVICCPTAAVSMRQLRSEKTPIHNSVTRIVEMMSAGVEVAIGTDNINDYLIPSGNGLVVRELTELSNYVREYVMHILAKIGMGVSLSNSDKAILQRSLQKTKEVCERHADRISGEPTPEISF